MSNSGIYKCLIPGIWIYQEPMSQRRKQLYGDFYVLRVFYPFLISLWACFEKSAMFCCECWWVSIEERRSLIIPDANYFDKKTVLHVIITSTLLLYPLRFAEILEKNSFSLLFYSFLLYLLFHKIKCKFCCEFIWISQWKKKRQQIKQNRNELIRFFLQHYLTDYPTVLYLFVCVCVFFLFFFNTEQGGQELELSVSLKRRKFSLGLPSITNLKFRLQQLEEIS